MCGKCVKEGMFMPWEKKKVAKCNVPKVAVAIDIITKNDDDNTNVPKAAVVNETKDNHDDDNHNDNTK